MFRLMFAILAAGVSLAIVPTVLAQPAATVKVTADPKLGSILTDPAGRTLYIFTRDDANVSNCYDKCAQRWAAYVVSSDAVAPAGLTGTLGVAPRRDSARQVTYNSMPLYYFSGDANPSDTNGQGVASVWFVVAPGATKASFPAPPPPAAAPAAAQPAPSQLPRTGAASFDQSLAVLGTILLGVGLAVRRRQTER